jgi:phospholipid transport system transporter-binding protein
MSLAMFASSFSLTFDTAKSVLDAGLRAVAEGHNEIDLSHLAAVDSTAVAALVAWQRAAVQRGGSLQFKNPPANLQSLADLYGVASLLHYAAADAAADVLPHH